MLPFSRHCSPSQHNSIFFTSSTSCMWDWIINFECNKHNNTRQWFCMSIKQEKASAMEIIYDDIPILSLASIHERFFDFFFVLGDFWLFLGILKRIRCCLAYKGKIIRKNKKSKTNSWVGKYYLERVLWKARGENFFLNKN